MGVKDNMGLPVIGMVTFMPMLYVSKNYVAIKGSKVYDFDPKTGTLRLNEEYFTKGELEKKADLQGEIPPQGICLDLHIKGYGDRRIHSVNKIEYYREIGSEDKVPREHPMPPKSLPQLIQQALRRLIQ